MDDGSPPPTPRGGLGKRVLVTMAASAALVGAVDRTLAGLPADEGEPLLLRWLRIWPEHPLRLTLASTLLFLALWPGTHRGAKNAA